LVGELVLSFDLQVGLNGSKNLDDGPGGAAIEEIARARFQCTSGAQSWNDAKDLQ
jgi:hypothetical protein